jgi:hypothetical protein
MPAFLYSAAADLERLLGVGPGRAAVGRADEQEWAARSLSQRFVAALIGSQEQAVAAARRSLESGAGNAAGWSWGIVAALGAHALMPPMPDLSTGSLSAFVGFGVTLGAGIAAGRAVRARVRSRVRDALDRRAAHLARLSELRARLETPLA